MSWSHHGTLRAYIYFRTIDFEMVVETGTCRGDTPGIPCTSFRCSDLHWIPRPSHSGNHNEAQGLPIRSPSAGDHLEGTNLDKIMVVVPGCGDIALANSR